MYPLSFKEYADFYQVPGDEKLYLQYIQTSSFPYTLFLSSQEEIEHYLEGIYNTILVKDIALRNAL